MNGMYLLTNAVIMLLIAFKDCNNRTQCLEVEADMHEAKIAHVIGWKTSRYGDNNHCTPATQVHQRQ